MASAMESAVVVPIPAAEALVSRLRSRYDPVAALGVPAHVTLLYPFVPPDEIDAELVGELRGLIGATAMFTAKLTATATFDDEVLYLVPEPATPFAELSLRLTERWPDYAPYDGRHQDLVPHLTVARASEGADLTSVGAALAAGLPVSADVDEVWLMTGGAAPRSWRRTVRFLLADED